MKRGWISACLLTVLVIAIVLRFHGLGRDSLSIDEGLTAELVELPANRLIPEMRKIEQLPPLYHLIMAGWIRLPHIGGTSSELLFRIPSALFGIGAVLTMYLLGARLFGAGTGLVAALLLAVSAAQIEKSQDARPYALFVLLSLFVCERFVAMLEDRKSRLGWTAVTLSVFTALLLYTQLYGATVIAAQACVLGVHGALIWRTRDGESWRAWLKIARAWAAAMIAAAVLFMPWVWVLLKGRGTGDISIRPGWIPGIDRLRLALIAIQYAGSPTLVAIYAIFMVIGIAWAIRRRLIGAELCLAMILCGIVAPLIVSVIWRPVFIYRYGLPAQAMLLMLVAAGIVGLAERLCHSRPAAAPWVVVALLLPIMVASRCWLPPLNPVLDWRGLVADLGGRIQSRDVIILPRWFEGYVVNHYRKHGAGADSQSVFLTIPAIAYDDPGRPPVAPRVHGRRVWWIVDTRVRPGDRPGEFAPTEHVLVSTHAFQNLELRELKPTG